MSQSVSLIPLAPSLPIKPFSLYESKVINHAIRLLENHLLQDSDCYSNPNLVSSYLQLKLANQANEVFAAMFLNSKHQLISFEILFQGSINKAVVYPRVIIQRALLLNASCLIVAHNHPSGVTTPSPADELLTATIKNAMKLVDIDLLDHFIVGNSKPFSFAEAGLL